MLCCGMSTSLWPRLPASEATKNPLWRWHCRHQAEVGGRPAFVMIRSGSGFWSGYSRQQLFADKLCGVCCLVLHAQPFDARAGAFSGAADDQLCCWQVTTEAPHLRLQTKLSLKQKGVAEIAVRQDGRVLASASWDGRIRIFRCAKPKPLAVLQVRCRVLLG